MPLFKEALDTAKRFVKAIHMECTGTEYLQLAQAIHEGKVTKEKLSEAKKHFEAVGIKPTIAELVAAAEKL